MSHIICGRCAPFRPVQRLIKAHFALHRRGLAYVAANLLDFEVHSQLFAHLWEQYIKPSLPGLANSLWSIFAQPTNGSGCAWLSSFVMEQVAFLVMLLGVQLELAWVLQPPPRSCVCKLHATFCAPFAKTRIFQADPASPS
eukprot:6490831-Amphidinium_carterae.1